MTFAYETARYGFAIHRAGASLTRKRNNTSVFFQPGEDADRAIADAEHCFGALEMHPGENARVFDTWAGEFATLFDAHAAHKTDEGED